MAEAPQTRLVFSDEACPDCAERVASLPGPLPPVPDDIDLRARDFDGFRRVMLEDLAARNPQRTRWSPADIDVVLVEVVATALDELSDMADRVIGEAYLDTARRPASVRWLLELIGARPVEDAVDAGVLPITRSDVSNETDQDEALRVAAAFLDQHWMRHPSAMAEAKAAGVRHLGDQERMVTVADHAERFEDHPLVARATAWSRWTGSWQRVHVALLTWDGTGLDDQPSVTGRLRGRLDDEVVRAVESFHADHDLPPPPWVLDPDPDGDTTPGAQDTITLRGMLQPLAERLRMVGIEVVLRDAVQVEVTIALSIEVGEAYYRSEVEAALRQVLGSAPGGLFAPGAQVFGRDLFASDVIEAAFTVDGVEDVCVNRFKRRGRRWPDRSSAGVIVLEDLEVPVLGVRDSSLRLHLHGGRVG